MHWLRERVAQRAERESMNHSIEEQQRFFDKYAPYLAYRDEQDERMLAGGRTTRSSANAERRGIERLFKLETESFQEGRFTEEEIRYYVERYGATPAELRNKVWVEMVEEYYGQLPDNRDGREQPHLDPENRKDVRDNYLYALWNRQLRNPNSVRTFPLFALFVSIKAAIELVAGRQQLDLEAAGIRYAGISPDRNRLIAFKQSLEYESSDVRSHLRIAGEVEGLLELAETLMQSYSDFVRVERELDSGNPDLVYSPLPDDPGNTSLAQRYEIPEYIRIESAVEAYIAKEGTSTEIAQKYKIAEKRFQNVLRERGLLAKRGGDRRKKG